MGLDVVFILPVPKTDQMYQVRINMINDDAQSKHVNEAFKKATESKDKRIAVLEAALEEAHKDLIKWGSDNGEFSRELNIDLGKISYALNGNP